MQFASGIRKALAVGVMATLPLTAACACNGDGGGGGGSGGGGGGGGTDPPNGTPPAAAMPDFVAEIVTWPSGLVPVPAGTQVRIDVTVTNVGVGDAANRVWVGIPSTVGARTERALAAGEAETVTIDFPAVSSNVTYTISATVDPENVTPEENESNNTSQQISFTTSP